MNKSNFKLMLAASLAAASLPALATTYLARHPVTGLREAAPTVQTITLQNGARRWSNGAAASSCAAYLAGDSAHAYQGSTGDGIYAVTVHGSTIPVYCDMTTDGGGWMLTLYANAPVISSAYDLTVGESMTSGSALKTATQDASAFPVLPTGLTNSYSQILFKGGTTSWTTKMGTWVRWSIVPSTSLSVAYSGVASSNGATAAYFWKRGWSTTAPTTADALSLWDAAGVSTICGGSGVFGGKNCPVFSQSGGLGSYSFHFDGSSSRQLFVR